MEIPDLGGAVKHQGMSSPRTVVRRVRVLVALAGVLMLVLTGCGGKPHDPSPVAPSVSKVKPTVAPSPTCTDPPGPCSEYDHEQEQLFEEAKARYLEYMKKFVAVDEAGGASPAPAWVDEYLAGVFKDITVAGFVGGLESNIKAEPGSFKKIKFTICRLNSRLDGSDVALHVCVDGSGMNSIYKKTGEVAGPGIVMEHKLYFKRIDGKLKIIRGIWKEVKKCDIG